MVLKDYGECVDKMLSLWCGYPKHNTEARIQAWVLALSDIKYRYDITIKN